MFWFKRLKYKKYLNNYKLIVDMLSQVIQSLLHDLGNVEQFFGYRDNEDILVIHSLSDATVLIMAYCDNPLSRPSTILALKNYEKCIKQFDELIKLKSAYKVYQLEISNIQKFGRPKKEDGEDAVTIYEKELSNALTRLGQIEIEANHIHSLILKEISRIRAILRYELIQVNTDADIIADRCGMIKKNKINIKINKVDQPEEKK